MQVVLYFHRTILRFALKYWLIKWLKQLSSSLCPRSALKQPCQSFPSVSSISISDPASVWPLRSAELRSTAALQPKGIPSPFPLSWDSRQHDPPDPSPLTPCMWVGHWKSQEALKWTAALTGAEMLISHTQLRVRKQSTDRKDHYEDITFPSSSPKALYISNKPEETNLQLHFLSFGIVISSWLDSPGCTSLKFHSY